MKEKLFIKRIFKNVVTASVILLCLLCFSGHGHAAVFDFQVTNISPGATSPHWSSFAASNNKQVMILADKGGRLYTSIDAGQNWAETRPLGDTNQNWALVNTDADGLIMIAATEMGRVYLSPDSGSSWSELQPAGDTNKNWSYIYVDKNGNIVCAVNGGRIYFSTDSGSSWSELQPAGDTNKNWSKVAPDSTFTNFIAIANPGRVYYSPNSGSSWSELQPLGNADQNWTSAGYSANEQKILVSSEVGRLYSITTDTMIVSEITPKGNQNGNWKGLILDNLENTFAAENLGRLYFSENDSVWNEVRPIGDNDKKWNAIDISSDSSTLYALEEDGGLYSITRSYRVPSAPGNIEIQTNSTLNNKIDGRAIYKSTELQKSATNIFKQAHGTKRIGNKIYLGTRTNPAKIVVFNNINDLSDYQAVSVVGYKNIEVMVYDQVNNRLYGMLYDPDIRDKLEIISINPDNIADYSIVYQSSSLPFAGGGPIVTDGEYLYAATTGNPVIIYKIRISDWTLVAQNTWTGANQAHAAQIYNYNDRCELYITSALSVSRLAKVNCSDLSYTDVALLGDTTATDDLTFKYKNEQGGTAYIGVETYNYMYSVDTATMTVKRNFGLKSYGMFDDGDSLYDMNFIGGYITKYNDYNVNDYKIYAFPGETPNEFFAKDGRKFFTHWNADVGYLKEYEETGDLYATSTVGFSWSSDITNALFDISYSNNGVDYTHLINSYSASIIVNTLQPNTQYWFKIIANNGSASSLPTVFTTTTPSLVVAQLATTPSLVTVSLNTNNNNATVSWADNGSSAYYVYDSNGLSSDWIGLTSYTFNNLACGDYTYYVKGRNIDGVETAVATTSLSVACGLKLSDSTFNLYRSNEPLFNNVNVSLLSPPTGNVVLVPVFSNNAASTTRSSLTFNSSNWNVPQNILFYSVPNTTSTQTILSFSTSSSDANYNNASFATATINIISYNSGGSSSSGGGCTGLCGGSSGSSSPPTSLNVPTQIIIFNQLLIISNPLTQTVQTTSSYIANNTSASLIIPAGSILTPATLEIKAKESISVPLPQVEIGKTTIFSPIGDVVFDISLKDNATQTNITSFPSSNLQLTINIPTIVSSEDVTTLGLYYLNENTNQWIRVEGATFNLVTKQVTANLNHLTKFAVFKLSENILNTELSVIKSDEVISQIKTTTPGSESNKLSNIVIPQLTKKQFSSYKNTFIKDKDNNIFFVNGKNNKVELVNLANSIPYLAKIALGMKNKDLNKISNISDKRTSNYSKKFTSKVLLAVEDKGQLWYVNKQGKKAKVYDSMSLLRVLAGKI